MNNQLTLESLIKRFDGMTKSEKIEILEEAIINLKKDSTRSREVCIALAMGYQLTDKWSKV